MRKNSFGVRYVISTLLVNGKKHFENNVGIVPEEISNMPLDTEGEKNAAVESINRISSEKLAPQDKDFLDELLAEIQRIKY